MSLDLSKPNRPQRRALLRHVQALASGGGGVTELEKSKERRDTLGEIESAIHSASRSIAKAYALLEQVK